MMKVTADGRVQPHNERPAAVWSAGGQGYDRVRVLDLSTGTGWTSRVVARRGATVTGVDIEDSIRFHAGFVTDLGICVPREYWLTFGIRG